MSRTKRAAKLKAQAADRERFAADVSASDLKRATAYFRRQFDGRDDNDQTGEALAYLWPEYCTERRKGTPHDPAMRRACKRAAGRVKRGSRFASTVPCPYVDAVNPADWHRRAELDAERTIMLSCGEDIRPDWKPAPPRNGQYAKPVARRRPKSRLSYRPLSGAVACKAQSPTAPGRQYGKARIAGGRELGGMRFNIDRIESRLDSGEWLFAYINRD